MNAFGGRKDRRSSLAGNSAGADRFLGGLLLASAVLLVLGWTLPVMTVKTLYIFNDELSILEGALRLWESGEILLFLLVFFFTLAFPVAKLAVAFIAWHHLSPGDRRLRTLLQWIERLGRWSMLDVFVVALAIVVVKVSFVSDVIIHAGLYVFAGAVVVSMVTVRRVATRAKQAADAMAGEASGSDSAPSD